MQHININLPDKNTRTAIPSLGKVELKYISAGDSQRFTGTVFSVASPKTISLKVLHQQIISPAIDFAGFEALPDSDLKELILAFAQNEKYTFKSFDATAKDLYTEFADSLKTYYKISTSEALKTLMPDYQSIANSLAALARQVQPVTITPTMQSIVDNAIGQTNLMKSAAEAILGPSRSLIEAQASVMSSISKIIAPNISVWQGWAQRNADIFSGTRKILEDFENKYRIAESEAIATLAKYKWFVSPSIPIDLIYEVQRINKLKGNQRKVVNKLFIDYFEQNNWEILDHLLTRWNNNDLFLSRNKILSDTFTTIQLSTSTDINITNVVLPTLIIQVDGILKDYMKENISVHFSDRNKIKTLKESGLIQPASDLEDLGMTIFLDILFQSSNPDTPLHTPFNLNRHKILHAENTRYGRKDYLVRILMVLDILAHLKSPNNNSDSSG